MDGQSGREVKEELMDGGIGEDEMMIKVKR